jgi:ankyrin repeat protein
MYVCQSRQTALLQACATGSAATIRALLAGGANPSPPADLVRKLNFFCIGCHHIPVAFCCSQMGQSPVHCAAFRESSEALVAMLEAGASAKVLGPVGEFGLASQLLLPSPFHLNTLAPQNNWTPLHYAALVSSVTSVRAILAAGADADAEATVSTVQQCLGAGLDALSKVVRIHVT